MSRWQWLISHFDEFKAILELLKKLAVDFPGVTASSLSAEDEALLADLEEFARQEAEKAAAGPEVSVAPQAFDGVTLLKLLPLIREYLPLIRQFLPVLLDLLKGRPQA